jgi:hypothetical protein
MCKEWKITTPNRTGKKITKQNRTTEGKRKAEKRRPATKKGERGEAGEAERLVGESHLKLVTPGSRGDFALAWGFLGFQARNIAQMTARRAAIACLK